MTSKYRLTTARVADLAAVMRVMESGFDPVFGEAWTRAQLLTLFALPSARVRVAWDGELAVGFAAARLAGPESELLLLAVDPALRGQGIGAKLVADWKIWAASESVEILFLEMRADNEAIHLYEQQGFTECGRRPDYYRGSDGKSRDAITMRHIRCSSKNE